MAIRVKSLRAGLLEKINQRGIDKDFSFITQHKGMFSYLGISKQ
jgi:aspartate/tyrosine/aromatic aminotransferase